MENEKGGDLYHIQHLSPPSLNCFPGGGRHPKILQDGIKMQDKDVLGDKFRGGGTIPSPAGSRLWWLLLNNHGSSLAVLPFVGNCPQLVAEAG